MERNTAPANLDRSPKLGCDARRQLALNGAWSTRGRAVLRCSADSPQLQVGAFLLCARGQPSLCGASLRRRGHATGARGHHHLQSDHDVCLQQLHIPARQCVADLAFTVSVGVIRHQAIASDGDGTTIGGTLRRENGDGNGQTATLLGRRGGRPSPRQIKLAGQRVSDTVDLIVGQSSVVNEDLSNIAIEVQPSAVRSDADLANGTNGQLRNWRCEGGLGLRPCRAVNEMRRFAGILAQGENVEAAQRRGRRGGSHVRRSQVVTKRSTELGRIGCARELDLKLGSSGSARHGERDRSSGQIAGPSHDKSSEWLHVVRKIVSCQETALESCVGVAERGRCGLGEAKDIVLVHDVLFDVRQSRCGSRKRTRADTLGLVSPGRDKGIGGNREKRRIIEPAAKVRMPGDLSKPVNDRSIGP
mmetsp:Transcript_16801/g.39603  ORF Transcript_16801/g.39603 Transcript_16801/m.39603 type:complete len:417 (-) Transcript_16801:79-1329(-)